MDIPQAPGRVLKSQTVTGTHPSRAHRDRGEVLLCSGPGHEPRKSQTHPQAAGSDADAGEGPACCPSAHECFDRERPAWPGVRTGNGSSGPGRWPSGRASWLTVLSHTLQGRRIQGKAPETGGCDNPRKVAAAVRGWVTSSLASAGLEGQAVLVALLGGHVAGLVSLAEREHFTRGMDACIGELAVAATLEGRGCGRALWPRRKSGRRAEGLLISPWRPEQTTIAPGTFTNVPAFRRRISASLSPSRRADDGALQTLTEVRGGPL